MDILGKYKNNYEDIFFEDETNTLQIYKAFNSKKQRSCCLKVISKEQLKMGDYDLLLEQIIEKKNLQNYVNQKI